ncbi:MAG: hypothetical protein ACFFDO_07725 [Candidatus Thorarchaeota archaeon]
MSLEKIIDSVIINCVNDISNSIYKNIKNGLDLFSAIDNAIEQYNLEDEIIIKFEIERSKKKFKLEDLDLSSETIKKISKNIKKIIYKKAIDEIEEK